MNSVAEIPSVSASFSSSCTAAEIFAITGKQMSQQAFRQEVLNDYRLVCESRETSLISRREVLTGKAKFGILGDGKEVPQVALAHIFQNGDFRAGYYRGQTFMLAIGEVTLQQLYAQLYAHADSIAEPHSAGRQMNAHFATQMLDEQGNWLALTERKNSSAEVSCTASQMSRAVGLALASKVYREIPDLQHLTQFSRHGNEVTFACIGDASTSEGVFWETINAAGVQQIPLVVCVWDDGYGISVPIKYQTTKGSISKVLSGFAITETQLYDEENKENGLLIYAIDGANYAEVRKLFQKVIPIVREKHVPVLLHFKNLTQPQGHSTSGSHERYKSKERLTWEKQHDCNKKMRKWILDKHLATENELQYIEQKAKKATRLAKKQAWQAFNAPIQEKITSFIDFSNQLLPNIYNKAAVLNAQKTLQTALNITFREILETIRSLLIDLRKEHMHVLQELINWKDRLQAQLQQTYSTYLYSTSPHSALKVPVVPPVYSESSPLKNGFEVLNACFDAAFARDPRLVAFGEDVGYIGDVNQGFAKLQNKYGIERIFDTGIRENTIIGQGMGLAMRGLRPIAEIQYLDYFIYGMQPVVDEISTLRYRSAGRQQAPVIIRSRGHRLEGIWHTGSPMGMILNGIRGVYIAVPRNMTQAAGFYNTLLQSDDPALVIECLNGYRLKERLPDNIDEFTVPLGVPEILTIGEDITIVTYGSCCRIAQKAVERLAEVGISVELIDVQTLLPFDIHHQIVGSLAKTNRILFVDEDVPGGASAFMLQQVLEKQNGYRYLDSPPTTLTATEHRTAFGSDGDYYCKPNEDDIFEAVYRIMHEADPFAFPMFF